MTGTVPVSVIILTFNEELNIGKCIESITWASDIIIVDSFSQDNTLQIAKAVCPEVRIFQNPFQDFGQQRNWAIDCTNTQHEWILFLDADEVVDAACAQGIAEAIQSNAPYVGYYLTYKNMFLGKWIKNSTLYPTWQLRLFKKGELRFRAEGHGQREVTEGELGFLTEPYIHYGFSKGVHDWVARHNHYSTNEVALIHKLAQEPLEWNQLLSSNPLVRRRFLKKIAARVGFRPLLRFLYLYVIRRGFLDGQAGLQFCLLRVAHEIHISVKLQESMQKEDNKPQEVNLTPESTQKSAVDDVVYNSYTV